MGVLGGVVVVQDSHSGAGVAVVSWKRGRQPARVASAGLGGTKQRGGVRVFWGWKRRVWELSKIFFLRALLAAYISNYGVEN